LRIFFSTISIIWSKFFGSLVNQIYYAFHASLKIHQSVTNHFKYCRQIPVQRYTHKCKVIIGLEAIIYRNCKSTNNTCRNHSLTRRWTVASDKLATMLKSPYSRCILSVFISPNYLYIQCSMCELKCSIFHNYWQDNPFFCYPSRTLL
jgi:hypothetical protein